MLEKFRTYNLAVEFYRECEKLIVPSHLRDHLLRASSSVVLNLAEGAGRFRSPDQQKFYRIAHGSFQECQAILTLARIDRLELTKLKGNLGGHLFGLCKPARVAVPRG